MSSPPPASRRTLCVISPCYNEGETVQRFYEELKRVLNSLGEFDHRIVFVDDGSTDDTLSILNSIAAVDQRVSVYSLSRNFGHQIALSAGLDAAQGDAVLLLDSDLQHPPGLIPAMVRLWLAGNDIVSGLRVATEDAGLLKRASSALFYWLVNRLTDIPVTPGAADFCLLSRPAYEALRRMPERHRFLRGMLGWIGFRRTYVEFRAPARAGGRSKYSVRKMIGLAGDAIFSFSFVPVRAIAIFGTGVCLVGMGYLGGEVAWRLATARFVGGTGIVVGLMMVLCGASVAATGLIGEYVVRTLDQVKGRPLYILKQQPDMGHSDQRKPA